MKKVMAISALFISACATTYAPKSFWNDGGFSETEIQPNLWQVRFSGNEFSTAEETLDYAMLRASELCLARGMKFIAFGEIATNIIDSGYIPGSTYTTTDADISDSGRITGSSQSFTTMGVQLYSPETGLTVACLDKKLEGAWDGDFLATSLKGKYKLP